ncbi:MAG: hypothetical protein IJN23_05135, partial [Akkermansia sp.]|nr:hypothetical protein [Akkermansia sp.]
QKAQHQCIASLSVTPSGLHFILSPSGGCARFAGLPPASVLSPTSWAQNSSGFQPDKHQFVGFSNYNRRIVTISGTETLFIVQS